MDPCVGGRNRIAGAAALLLDAVGLPTLGHRLVGTRVLWQLLLLGVRLKIGWAVASLLPRHGRGQYPSRVGPN
ncbi:MAG TPA: hypothetical protein VF065_08160, partial [Ilumatobacter sp.]